MNNRIVFCGGGNMAEGILRQILAKQVTESEYVTVVELRQERCDYLKAQYEINAVTNPAEAYKQADLIILAVLPQFIENVCQTIEDQLRSDTVVMSIAAGVSLNRLQKALNETARISRVMPNTLSQSGSGYSAVCYNDRCSEEDTALVSEILEALGQTLLLPEEKFDSFSCFGTAGPLWMYKLIEAMTDAGVYVGYNRTDARNIVIRNMVGAATVLAQTGDHPVIRVDQMTSPGGVTIESLKVLQEEGFAKAVMDSVIAGVRKAESF